MKNLKNKQIIFKTIDILCCVLMPVLLFYFMEMTIRYPLTKLSGKVQFLNILFFELFFLLFFFIFGKAKIALRIEIVTFGLIGLVDYFIISFRGTPVMPWDLLSIATAASVADNYKYTLTARVIWILIAYIILFILLGKSKFNLPKKIWFRMVCIACTLLLTFGYVNYVQSPKAIKSFRLYDKLFTPTTMTYRDGTVVAFLMQAQYMAVEKPEGYSKKEAEALLGTYNEQPEIEQKPNIIVIMNEAFSDLTVLDQFTTNEEVMPFFKHMTTKAPNTVSGFLDVSVLGGNTANTEFEFLTGNTMAFLPQGSVPYQQYVKSETESLASILKGYGYETYAMHPYNAKGWDRHLVYEHFGFDHYISKADFDNPQLIRNYISDQADVDKIKELYESKDSQKPMFMFNVTMQNHSSYTDAHENFTPGISVEGTDSFALNQYLSLLKESDKALEDLINYFDSVDEPTIIVFFGDHQPTDSVVSPIYKLNGRSVYSLEDEELFDRYKVPYFIHANFTISANQNQDTSINYLGCDVFDLAGLPKTNYQTYLSYLQTIYPSITALQVTDHEGNVYAIDEMKDNLNEYNTIQYYQLFE